MKIELDIPADRINNLMITFIESGDPVSRGWCTEVNLIQGGEKHDNWYADEKLWAGDFVIEVSELDDESAGTEINHKITPATMAKGLEVMAAKFGHLFQQITSDDIDAPCADIFMQCILFGEEKYA